jgi:D-cysteine desulfhydrase
MWGGPTLYIKRDDLTGCGVSGNKVRKLEFSVAEALNQGADTLITCGGIQSNHARATAVVAARMGLKPFLVLRGPVDSEVDGNLLLDRLVDAEIEFITKEAYAEVDDLMEKVAARLRERGQRPYIIPEGASNEVGYFGYIRAAEEIAKQTDRMHLNLDAVIVATGSGGTLGGLILGQRFLGLSALPIGINVCDTAETFQDRILPVLQSMNDQFDWQMQFSAEEIQLIDGYVGEGYALSRPEELELIREVARTEGIFLDPVYTGKTMFGIRDQIQKGRFKKGENVLFIHTGGIYGIFPQRQLFTEIWQE